MTEGHWEHRETNPTTGKEYFDWKKGPKHKKERKAPIPKIAPQQTPFIRGTFNADLVHQGMENREERKETQPAVPSEKPQE